MKINDPTTTQNQDCGTFVAHLETLCDDLQIKFEKTQVVNDQNFATVNAKLKKIEAILEQLSQFITEINENQFKE